MKPYDLLWPVNKRLDTGAEAKVVEVAGDTMTNHMSMFSSALSFISYLKLMFPSGTTSYSADVTFESVRSYAASLLATLPNAKGKSCAVASDVSVGGPSAKNASAESEESWRIEKDRESVSEGGLTGCREAVELLTRNQRKGASFFTYCDYGLIHQ